MSHTPTNNVKPAQSPSAGDVAKPDINTLRVGDAACAKFQDYGCGCQHCHDCGYPKDGHTVASPAAVGDGQADESFEALDREIAKALEPSAADVTDNPVLLPCPFCGGGAGFGWGELNTNELAVGCFACYILQTHEDPEKSVELWNRRATAPAPSVAPDPASVTAALHAIANMQPLIDGDYVLLASAMRQIAKEALATQPSPAPDAKRDLLRAAENLYAFAEGVGRAHLTRQGWQQVENAYAVLKAHGSKMPAPSPYDLPAPPSAGKGDRRG